MEITEKEYAEFCKSRFEDAVRTKSPVWFASLRVVDFKSQVAGSSKRKCFRCRELVWVSPPGQSMLKEARIKGVKVNVVCQVCALEEIQRKIKQEAGVIAG